MNYFIYRVEPDPDSEQKLSDIHVHTEIHEGDNTLLGSIEVVEGQKLTPSLLKIWLSHRLVFLGLPQTVNTLLWYPTHELPDNTLTAPEGDQ